MLGMCQKLKFCHSEFRIFSRDEESLAHKFQYHVMVMGMRDLLLIMTRLGFLMQPRIGIIVCKFCIG